MSDAQPLAVQLARERFRQQAMAGLLTGMNTDPAAMSHDLGGELWLMLTQSVCDRIEEGHTAGLSPDELIEAVRSDLSRACHLVLERNRQGDGPILKINSANWFLIVKPDCPAWVVVAIRPQTMEFRESLTGLPWRLIRSDDETANALPLPLWLLAQAQLRDRELSTLR